MWFLVGSNGDKQRGGEACHPHNSQVPCPACNEPNAGHVPLRGYAH